jgi:DNA-binding beta-propeller fold protein YncE
MLFAGVYFCDSGSAQITTVSPRLKTLPQDKLKNFLLSTKELNFGHDLEEATVYLTNISSKDLSWSAAPAQSWASVAPASATILDPQTLSADASYRHVTMWPQSLQLANLWYVINPESVGIDLEGNIYVVDSGSSPIQKFNQYEEFLYEMNPSNNPQSPLYPRHIAFDSNNNFYVVDSAQSVVQFDKNGNYIQSLIFPTNFPLPIAPYDIAISAANEIYITDVNNFKIHKFDQNGNYLLSWGSKGLGDGQFDSQSFKVGIVVDRLDGNVYVADNHYERIQRFDPQGNFVDSFCAGELVADCKQLISESHFQEGFAIDQHVLYVVHEDMGFIRKFKTDGTPVAFLNPTQWFTDLGWYSQGDLSITPSGDIYMAGNDRTIAKFNKDGDLLAFFKSHVKEQPGAFYWPVGVAVDQEGDLYIRDENEKIQKFDATGKLKQSWDIAGIYPLINPLDSMSMSVDVQKNMYIAQQNFLLKLGSQGEVKNIWTFSQYTALGVMAMDYPHDQIFMLAEGAAPTFAQKLVKLDIQGNVLWEVNLNFIPNPYTITDIAVDQGKNTLYLSSRTDGVYQFNFNGVLLSHFNYAPALKPSWFGGSTSLTVDQDGYIYVLFYDSAEVHKYDANGNFLTSWGQGGTKAGELLLRGSNWIRSCGNHICVIEHGSNRVQVFSQASFPVTISVDKTSLPLGQSLSEVIFTKMGPLAGLPVKLKVTVEK